MGWFDGFPFKSKTQMERERREFESRIFPFGLEAQRAAALAVLRAVVQNDKLPNEELLYCFIAAKDAYLSVDTQSEGLAAMDKIFGRQRKLAEEERRKITALVLLDNKAPSLEEYPRPSEVLELAKTL